MAGLDEKELPKNSFVFRFNRIERRTKISLIIGVVLLIILYIAIVLYILVAKEQVEDDMLLNQYRMGSKTLTSLVQSYVVTGDQEYYDAYLKELEKDQNRDKALEGLKENNIRKEEWDKLQKIASLSDSLVPIEKEALELSTSGDKEAAIEYVFGEDYEEQIQRISSLTDETISQIQKRVEKERMLFLIITIVCGLNFAAASLYVGMQCRKTIRFAKDDLLSSILVVSEQMRYLSEGHLDAPMEIKVEENEVGQMLKDISHMKKSLSDIIEEITIILDQMGQGNFRVEIEQEYIGNFEAVKEAFSDIVLSMRSIVDTLHVVADEVEHGSSMLADASEELAIDCTKQAAVMSDLMGFIKELQDKIPADEQQERQMQRFIQKLKEGMDQLAGMIDNNSATAQQTAAISQQQKAQAESMVKNVNRLQL